MATYWYQEAMLVAMFFFSQEGSSVRTAGDLCFSFADQIEEYDRSPALKAYWANLAPSRKNLASRDIEEQWEKLVHKPLSLLSRKDVSLLVIDAIDECTIATRVFLLQCLLASVSSGALPNIRILLTTRNEPDIQQVLQHETLGATIIHKSLHAPTDPAGNDEDIAFYLDHRLSQMRAFDFTPVERTQRCNGLFIFAFLACELLKESYTKPQPFRDILNEFTPLDALYHRVLTRADGNPKYTRDVLRMILGVIVVAQVPLSIAAISSLLPETTDPVDVGGIVSNLGSIISSGGFDEPVYILHATFMEFPLRQRWVTSNSNTARKDDRRPVGSAWESWPMRTRGQGIILGGFLANFWSP